MKLNKIILRTDIVLGVGTPTPGERGQVLVTQDGTGFHVVQLPDGHLGNIVVEQHPGKTTLLEYIVDDVGVYWTSTILTPADDISDPSQITDLTYSYLNAASVQINFTAPSGNMTLSAERYNIYYSNAPIDDGTVLTNLDMYKNNYIPKEPGTTETFTLTGLTPNQVYYFAIVAQLTTFGKTRVGATSNIITFTTLPLEGGGSSGTDPILIPVKSYNVGSYYINYDADTDGNLLDLPNLVDYSTVSVVDNAPSGTPANLMRTIHDNQYKADYYNQRQTIIFNLGFEYILNSMYIYPIQGSNEWTVEYSSDGASWVTGGTIDTGEGKNEWIAASLASAPLYSVKYIRLTLGEWGGVYAWGSVAFMGRRQSAQDISGKKFKHVGPGLTLDKFIGTNSNIAQDIPITNDVANMVRMYSNVIWYQDPTLFGQGATVTHDSVRYKFATSNVGNSDDYLGALKAAGHDILFCLVGMPYFLSGLDISDGLVKTRKPLDTGLSMTLANTTNPLNYTFIAQFYWQLAARYGSTTGQSNSLFRIDSTDTIKKGLGYIKYYEMGMNECTATSPDVTRTTNPEELAAILSAIWDGHKGAMGAGYGIKDADPTAVPVMCGLTTLETEYKLAMFRWWDANRGVGDYPIKVVNEHFYNIQGGRKNFDNLYGMTSIWSSPPEKDDFIPYLTEEIETLHRTPALQNIEYWVTEFGYDEHDGPFAPYALNHTTRALLKSYWILRGFLVANMVGLDRLCQYCVFGINPISELPDPGQLGPGEYTYNNFATSGYIDGNSGTTKLPAYYYTTAFRKAMTGYKFSHVITKAGEQYSQDLVTAPITDLWALAYKSDDDSKKDMIVMWLGTDSLTSSANVTTYVGISESTVNVITFPDLETTHNTYGTTASVSSTLSGSTRYISVTAKACPTIVLTDNISVGTLITPQDLEIQALTATQIKLVWTDKNIGTNNTRIYRSTDPGTSYTQIHDDYIDNGAFIDTGLTENTAYYYKIQFDSGSSLSSLSGVIGISTLRVIDVPGAFGVTLKTPTSIKMGWTYDSDLATYIDGYELWRSTTIDGVYSRVKTVSNNLLVVTDTGLVPNTTYYYKLRAYKGLSFGDYTTALGTTTDPISLNTPELLSTETSYSGDRLTLQFDLPIDDPSGQESNFTVILNGTTYLTPLYVTANAADNTKINLQLETGVTSNSDTITYSYNGTTGTIQSIYGVKIDSISSESATNRYYDSALLSKYIQVNLCTDTVGSGLTAWNDFSVTGLPYNSTQKVIATKNVDGANTGYNFTLNEDQPDTHIQGNYDVSATYGSYFATGDASNAFFPIPVRYVGGVVNGDGNNTVTFALMKLNTDKIYNVRVYGWLYPGNTGVLTVRGNFDSRTDKAINPIGGNVEQMAYITNLSPSNLSLFITSGNATADGYNSAKVTVTCTATGDNCGIAGMIFEEVTDN